MRWLLAGYCALVNLSVALTHSVIQMPRFYGVKTGQKVLIKCMSSARHLPAHVKWYKTPMYDDAPDSRVLLQKPNTFNHSQTLNAYLFLNGTTFENVGVYFCKVNDTWGPGTALEVSRPVNRENAVYRSKVKDGIMLLQGLLLAVFVAALLQNKATLTKRMDSEYEEPETNHIYEGLMIETCGGGLYEELSIYAQTEGAEAPWE